MKTWSHAWRGNLMIDNDKNGSADFDDADKSDDAVIDEVGMKVWIARSS
jgi:hypothetical protein